MNVLLTGSTGYIGRRLMRILSGDSRIQLRVLVRNKSKLADLPVGTELMTGDTFDLEALRESLRGIHTALYLIHSMGGERGADFEELDRLSARNFRDMCIESGVKRIIYLGGLGNPATASKHLKSRLETGEILSAEERRIQTIWFRAGIIIGSGGSSYEIIRHLLEKLPVMLAPKWLSTRTQSIAVGDVLRYLHDAIFIEHQGNLVVDIGAEVITFREILLQGAKALGLRRKVIMVPFFTPRLSSYWLILFTPVPYTIASSLVEGLRSETIVQNDNARIFFPGIKPVSYFDAFREAVGEVESSRIVSRWCDSSGGSRCDIPEPEPIEKAFLRDSCSISSAGVGSARIYSTLLGMGGANGWFSMGFLWKLRGFLDKMIGGYGLNRGRRLKGELRIGDALDFWKVADLVEERRVLLLAQMKLPGRAWLEFVIEPTRLRLTAYFIPRGIAGRLYWYASYPLHLIMFRAMLRNIKKQAKARP